MTLRWGGSSGNLVAVGVRGIYTIQTVRGQYVLQGVGHDELPMAALPALGHWFGVLEFAKRHAEKIEQAPADAEVSGG